MKQYFTYVRPFFNGAWYPVEYGVEKNFRGINYEANFCVVKGNEYDGRVLGFIEIEDQTKPSGVSVIGEDAINAILTNINATKETVTQAQEKVLRWTEVTTTIVDEELVFPVLIDSLFNI